jgi:hypothetical protein
MKDLLGSPQQPIVRVALMVCLAVGSMATPRAQTFKVTPSGAPGRSNIGSGTKQSPISAQLDGNVTNLSEGSVGASGKAGNSTLNTQGFNALPNNDGAYIDTQINRSMTPNDTFSSAAGRVAAPDSSVDSESAPISSFSTRYVGGSSGHGTEKAPEANSLILLLGGASVVPVLSLFKRNKTRNDSR